jgi:hypothetical protein
MCHEDGFFCGFHTVVGFSDKGKCGELNEKKQVMLNNIYIPSRWIVLLQKLVIGWVAGVQLLAGMSTSLFVAVSSPRRGSALSLV